jgi:hypothetical protein
MMREELRQQHILHETRFFDAFEAARLLDANEPQKGECDMVR